MANAEMVVVGCKLPNGLILTVGEKSVRVNGSSYFVSSMPNRPKKNEQIEYADGLTVVEKAHWDAWLEMHKNYDPVKSKAIYASSSEKEAKAKAKDTEGEKTGFERLDPTKHGVEPLAR